MAPCARGRGFGDVGEREERGESVEVVEVEIERVVIADGEGILMRESDGGSLVSLFGRDLGRKVRPSRVLRLGLGGGESILVF